MMPRYDDSEFWAAGLAGAFALGIVEHAPGDAARAAWTVVAPLGITLRPAPPPRERGPRVAKVDREQAMAIVEEVAKLYPDMLTAAGLHHERTLWDAAVAREARWMTYLERCRAAFWGGPYCEGRLDCKIHDAARRLRRDDFIRASCAFGSMVYDMRGIFHPPCPWWMARNAGEAAILMAGVLGERGWAEVERIAAMTRGMRTG